MEDNHPKRENMAVILYQPKLSENIGTTARAAANMGVGQLIVVQPYHLEKQVLLSMGTRLAHPLIEGMLVYDNLLEALADFQFVVGTTARRGARRGPIDTPRGIAKKIMALGPETRVALLFGPERMGLTKAELRLCQALVTIPTANPKVSSLNLAQAVLIIGYELLMAGLPESQPGRVKMAPMSQVQAMYDDLSKTLVDIGFLPDKNTGHWLMTFKRIFNRSGLTTGDCNLLRGVCRQINWAVQFKHRESPGNPPDKAS